MYKKLCTAGCWICPAIKERRREPGRDGVTQDAAHKEFCWTFPLYRPSRSLEQFRTQGLESTAGQRCARKSTEFASTSKIVRDSRGEMENSSLTQDSTHRGFCFNSPVVHVQIDLHALIMNNCEHRILRKEPINTAVQRCASRSTEFASR